MTAAIARITVSVASLEKALALYERALGLRRTREFPGIVGLGLARDVELLLHERTPTPGDAGVAPSFRVADVDAVTAAVLEAGARLIDAPADQPWGERQSVLHDADGHVFCLVTPLH